MKRIMVEIEVPEGRLCWSAKLDCRFRGHTFNEVDYCKLFQCSLTPDGLIVLKCSQCLALSESKNETEDE